METDKIVDATNKFLNAKTARQWLVNHLDGDANGLILDVAGNRLDRYLDGATRRAIAYMLKQQVQERYEEAEAALCEVMRGALAAHDTKPQ